MKNVKITSLIMILLIISCQPVENKETNVLDFQGHRGARGLLPENSIPGFIKALDLGVTTLELDLCVTKDKQLVLSHEPIMSAMICVDPLGNSYDDSLAYVYNIYEMTYSEVKSFNCGSLPHPWFPEQENIATYKPLLTEVFDTVANYLSMSVDVKSINYNIEIKTQLASDSVFHPSVKEFSDLVYKTISDKIDWKYITIQAFDFRVLQYFHEVYPKVKLALLIENKLPISVNLDSLGFNPTIYSCEHILLGESTIDSLHQADILVIPWTVNDKEDMNRLIGWGVDGLISDYPNRFSELYN